MVTFVIAIGYFCFQLNDNVQWAITAAPSFIVFVLIVWEIRVHWK